MAGSRVRAAARQRQLALRGPRGRPQQEERTAARGDPAAGRGAAHRRRRLGGVAVADRRPVTCDQVSCFGRRAGRTVTEASLKGEGDGGGWRCGGGCEKAAHVSAAVVAVAVEGVVVALAVYCNVAVPSPERVGPHRLNNLAAAVALAGPTVSTASSSNCCLQRLAAASKRLPASPCT